MSAAVCGSKRSFFEDLPSSSPPISKRIRCSSSSPIRLSSPTLIDQLRTVFPHMNPQLLERALEKCGNDLDAAIKSLHKLCIGAAVENRVSDEGQETKVDKGLRTDNGDTSGSENPSAPSSLPLDGAEWIDLFVREMMGATSVDDARTRATRALETLEKFISERVGAEITQTLHMENMHLKEQIEVLHRENTFLKRAVAMLHERQKELEDGNQELQYLRQLVSQYQEQLRTLEVANYALTMHLKQAQQGSSIPGRFHPDVF